MKNTRPFDTACPPLFALAEAAMCGSERYARHVGECSACAANWQRLHAVQSQWPSFESAAKEEGSCPRPIEWALLADQKISTGRRLELLAHLAACDACCALWKFLVDSIEEPPRAWELRERVTRLAVPVHAFEPGAEGRNYFSSVSAFRWVATVGSIGFLVVAALNLFPSIGPGGSSRWRGPAARLASEIRGTEAEATVPTLTWERVPRATTYRVRVWRSTGELLLEDHVPGPALERVLDLPRLSAGDEILFEVVALRDGETVAAGRVGRYRWQRP